MIFFPTFNRFLEKSRGAKPREAFSLIQLLAAIAITVTLAALLFPTIQTALRSSENVKCTGNLRAVGGALHAYIVDHNGEYPPNRNRPEGQRKFPSEALSAYIPPPGTIARRKDAGVWFCPGDVERPMELSARSYAQHSRLGAAPAEEPWWVKPGAAERSGELIYLVDHDLVRTPRTTAGSFGEKSWPLPSGSTRQPSGEPQVDFTRHHGHANALFVDGSVRPLRFDDLRETRWRYVDPTR